MKGCRRKLQQKSNKLNTWCNITCTFYIYHGNIKYLFFGLKSKIFETQPEAKKVAGGFH